MASGKLIAGFMIFSFIGFFGLFFYVTKYSQGREHNRQEQARELERQVCLDQMKKYIEAMKFKKEPVLVEKLNELCGAYEFYFFPDNFLDMRKILIISAAESMLQPKSFNGELLEKSISMGYFVMYGDQFKIKDIERDTVITVLRKEFKITAEDEKSIYPLIKEGEYGSKISSEILQNEGKVFLLKKKLNAK
jgi:hypothetical protein